MTAVDVVVRGGRLAATGAVADVGILGGRIEQIGGEMSAPREIDARGKLILPGGVDAHVHLSSPPGRADSGPRWVDDFTSGSAAALAGGITTVGNMTFLGPDETLLEGLRRESALAQSQAMADVFLRPVVPVPDQTVLAEIARLRDAGVSSIKIFLPTSGFDANLAAYAHAIERAGRSGLLTMLHCEDFSVLEHVTAELTAAGQTALRHFPASRPPLAEVVATQRAVALCELNGAAVYIVHLSCARALEVCADAQRRGLPVYVETRPLYLHLTQEVFETDRECGRFVGQPPLRGRDDVAALWAGLQSGSVHTVCTDHAPWSLAAKLDPALSITNLRPGVENLQLLLPMLYSEGVRTGRISLTRLVELTASYAARLFGLYPRKGTVAVGSDADLVVFDPEVRRTVSDDMLHSNADYTVYAGWEVTGWPVLTMRRGEIAFEHDQILAKPGSGEVLACGPSASL